MKQINPFALFKIIGIFIALGFIAITLSQDEIKINSYNATITLNESGDMTVVEEWDMHYDEQMNVRFRDIVYDKYPENYNLYEGTNNIASIDKTNINAMFIKDGVDATSLISVGYSFNNDYDELGYRVKCEPDVPYCDSIFVNTTFAGGMNGDVTFIYEYTILGAVTQYSDISELNWKLFTYAESKIDEAHITVNLPDNTFDKTSLLVWGHGLSEGTINIASNKQVIMDIKNIKTNEFIEFRILAENELFPNIREANKVISSSINKSIIMSYESNLAIDYNKRVVIAQILEYSTYGMLILMGIIIYIVYTKYDKEYKPDFQGDYYRELPNGDTPAEVSYLYYMKKIDDEVFTATMLDLIRRKYIILGNSSADISSSKSNFQLTLNKESEIALLLPHEEHFIHWIFNTIGNGTEVSTKDIESYGKASVSNAQNFQNNAKKFKRLAKQSGEANKYFESGLFLLNKKKVASAIFIPIVMMIVSIILSMNFAINISLTILLSIAIIIIYSMYISSIKKRSKQGNELYVKWKAFRNFLENFSSMNDYPIPGIVVWEHYLVYATVLKIADKVMSQLRVKLPEDSFNDENGTFMKGTSMSSRYFYSSMHHNFHTTFSIASMNSNATIVQYRASQAGSSGRGGGFGGGSLFGGGGGGGRSR